MDGERTRLGNIDTDSVSPTHSVTDSPGGNYPPNSNATMTLKNQINLAGSTAPVLSFWHKIYVADNCNWDFGLVEISTDGGLSWSTLKSYTCTYINSWTYELLDLSSYKNSSILIRFRMWSNNNGTIGDGWYIDDVEIKEKDTETWPFPFSDNFESGFGKWIVSGQDWAIIDTDSVSPTHSVTDSPGGNYPPNSNATMTLKNQINLAGSTAPVLSFWHKIYVADNCNWDFGLVEISTDGGLSWSTLKSYTCTYINSWTYELLDLSSYKNSSILIRFRMWSNNNGTIGDGWYIDDVEIKGTQFINPIPDIKANGSDGPITITRADTLSINVSLDAGTYAGDNADWWALANTPLGWYRYNVSKKNWQPGMAVTYQWPLFNLAPYQIMNMSGLPVGTHTFYFGVDMLMNGSPDMGQMYYDSVGVNVTP